MQAIPGHTPPLENGFYCKLMVLQSMEVSCPKLQAEDQFLPYHTAYTELQKLYTSKTA